MARRKAKSGKRKRTRSHKLSRALWGTTRERAYALLSDLRRHKGSYGQLLRKHHLDTRTAHRYLGRDLVGGRDGEPVRASKADRRVRELLFPTALGDVPFRTRSSRDASKLSSFLRDRGKLLRRKLSVADFERKWRGVRVAGRELFADVGVILRLADEDRLKVESLYASTGGAR